MARTRSTEKAAELAAAKAELARLQAMKAAGAPPLPADQPPRAVSDRSAIEEELAAARAERDALLELKREKEAREQAEAKASLARTRSAEKAAELAAAKAELARLKAMKAGGGVGGAGVGTGTGVGGGAGVGIIRLGSVAQHASKLYWPPQQMASP